MIETPIEKIRKKLSEQIPEDLVNKMPDKWEKIGDTVTITFPSNLGDYEKVIGKIFADVLNCKTTLKDVGGIKGELRKPDVKIIYGSVNTETVHAENGIRYKLDPQKVMFSSGNIDERIRMSKISNKREIVVDLFAGIGYFTLPIAVYSKPKKIFACEKNPVSYYYLTENVKLNDVTSIVEPIKGDNRIVAPKDVADRVVMGYLGNTEKFLPTALECLHNKVGFIHFHETFSKHEIPEKPLKNIQKVALSYNRYAKLKKYKDVKSYAPGINHFVFDFEIDEK